MKYYSIVYNDFGWSLLQSKGFETVKEAKESAVSIMGWSEDKRPLNIIHEMWVSCLQEWPTPEEQEEARIHCLNLKNQESSLQFQEAEKNKAV